VPGVKDAFGVLVTALEPEGGEEDLEAGYGFGVLPINK